MISLFKNPQKDEAKNYTRNLVRMATADEILHPSEIRFIKKIGAQKGLTDKEVNKLLNENKKGSVEIPQDNEEKFDLLYDITELMLCDGVITDSEFTFCEEMAKKLGFSSTIVNVLVAKIERAITNKEDKTEVKEHASALINY